MTPVRMQAPLRAQAPVRVQAPIRVRASGRRAASASDDVFVLLSALFVPPSVGYSFGPKRIR